MIPENERARRGKALLYKTNAHEVPRAFRGEEEQQRATQTDKKPPDSVLFAVSSYMPGAIQRE